MIHTVFMTRDHMLRAHRSASNDVAQIDARNDHFMFTNLVSSDLKENRIEFIANLARGYLAEAALAKFLGIPYDHLLDRQSGYDGGYDVVTKNKLMIDVKSTDHPNGNRLIIPPNITQAKEGIHAFVLVRLNKNRITQEGRPAELLGFVWFHEFFGFNKTSDGTDGLFKKTKYMTTDQLHDVKGLIHAKRPIY